MHTEQRVARRNKVGRAWAAYLELTETAEWIERKLWTPLDVFGLTREEFRLMLMLYRDGTVVLGEAAEKLGRLRQAVHETILRAEESGWVRREVARLPPAKFRESRLSKSRRGKPRQGLRVSRVSLTGQGERLIGNVLPKQEKIVKSLLHALNSRELESLTKICQKLRRSELVPFWSEIVRQRKEFDEAVIGGQ